MQYEDPVRSLQFDSSKIIVGSGDSLKVENWVIALISSSHRDRPHLCTHSLPLLICIVPINRSMTESLNSTPTIPDILTQWRVSASQTLFLPLVARIQQSACGRGSKQHTHDHFHETKTSNKIDACIHLSRCHHKRGRSGFER